MKAWLLLISGAVSPYLFSAVLPSRLAVLLFLLIVALVLIPVPRPVLRQVLLFATAFLFTTLFLNHRLDQRLPEVENKSIHEVSGVIGSLPVRRNDQLSFVFLTDRGVASVPARLKVSWYARKETAGETGLPEVHAGEHWRLQLELRTTRGRVNFHGVDPERWLFVDSVDALAYVKAGDNLRLAGPGMFDLQHWREMVLTKIQEVAADTPALRILLALAVADRRELHKHDRDIFSATGTGHLLAISGLHIGLAAIMGFYVGRILLLMLPAGLYLRLAIALPWVSAWLMALLYSGLSGFGVSTQRALLMLCVTTVVVLCRRKVHPAQAWLMAMALVLLIDPLAPLRAGFWFSFVAVAVLLLLFTPRYGNMPAWKRMIVAQLGISLVMAPLGMYWFQQASLPGMIANLVAIPVISFLVVPLILAGMFSLLLPGPVAGCLFLMAGHSVQYLMAFLEKLAMIQPEMFSATQIPGLAGTLLAMLGGLIIMLPRGLPVRFAGVLLIIPILLPVSRPIENSGVQIDLLDVGQGLSVLVGNDDYLLVYDTGPGNGLDGEAAWNMVTGTISPMIDQRGRDPDLLVVSHADLDHAGGLARLQAVYPETGVLASFPAPVTGITRCSTPGHWSAGGMRFKILHPSVGLPYLGNDSSCVISVHGLGMSLLLSGDISHVVERRLSHGLLDEHHVIVVPHHGSSTSSSQHLIDTVQPELVLVSAAFNNRFGFPRGDVVARYKKAHARMFNSAMCGGVKITADRQGTYVVESARKVRKAIWRWPASEECA